MIQIIKLIVLHCSLTHNIIYSLKFEQSILYPSSEIFEVNVNLMPNNARSYDIYWKLPGNDMDLNKRSFPPIKTDLNRWTINECDDNLWKKKTFIILFGDSHERIALSGFLENCHAIREQQYCCDIEHENKINVTFCNIFSFGVDPNLNVNSKSTHGIQGHAQGSHEINYKDRIVGSIRDWNKRYNIDLENKCSSEQWSCHVLFHSELWDITGGSNLAKDQMYEKDLLNLYNYIKYDGLRFIGASNNIIWRDQPIPAKWSVADRRNDHKIGELALFNQIGYNLFYGKMINKEMRILKWTNFVPLAHGGDDHHWHHDYFELYLGLIYLFTTLEVEHDNPTHSSTLNLISTMEKRFSSSYSSWKQMASELVEKFDD
eukprot:214416_1